MLFRALIDRMSVGETSDRYAEDHHANTEVALINEERNDLATIVIKLLRRTAARPEPSPILQQASERASTTEVVSPALEIIQRSLLQGVPKDLLFNLVLEQTGSEVWILREQAARTFVHLLKQADYLIELGRILQFRSDRNNCLHGRLLCARYILERLFQTTEAKTMQKTTNQAAEAVFRDVIFSGLETYHRDVIQSNMCPFVKAAFYDVLNCIMHGAIRNAESSGFLLIWIRSRDFKKILASAIEPSRRWLSTKPVSSIWQANSLSRRSGTLTSALTHFIRRDNSDFPYIFLSAASDDIDAANYALERLCDAITNAQGAGLLIAILVEILRRGPNDTLSNTIFPCLAILATDFDHVREFGIVILSDAHLREDLLSAIDTVQRSDEFSNRKTLDAALNLQGHLLAAAKRDSVFVGEGRIVYENRYRRWIRALKLALKDDNVGCSYHAKSLKTRLLTCPRTSLLE